MAENIVAGLFGLTPQMYGEQQRQSALAEGIRLAQLDPASRGAAMTYAGARGLGGAFANALGVEDPQLKMISARNSVFQQIDQSNPESMVQGIKMLSQMGDQQGAMALADYYRKAQSETALAQQRTAAAGRERQQAINPNIQISDQVANLKIGIERLQATPESPERNETLNALTIRLAELQRLTDKEKQPEFLQKEARLQELKASLRVLKNQPEPNKEAILRLEDSIQAIEGVEKDPRFGVDREAIAGEMFDNKSFSQLTASEKAVVNKRVDAEKPRTTITNVMPGDKTLADIPAFRASVQRTIDPQLKAVTAADNALENIQDSINTNNFASFRAAQTQFARAISGTGDLSQKELLAAGADPSLLGGTADYLARLFTSTPTLDTQEKIKKTLLAIKKVSTNKAKTEIEAQRKIAYSNPGYDKARVDQALDFPEFSGQPSSAGIGDLAEQARSLLKQRQEGKK